MYIRASSSPLLERTISRASVAWLSDGPDCPCQMPSMESAALPGVVERSIEQAKRMGRRERGDIFMTAFSRRTEPKRKVEMMQGRVKTARPALALKETKFENDRLARLGVEAMSFSYLFKRTTVRALSLPERVHFYML